MITPSIRARTVLATSSHVELGILGEREMVPAHLVDPKGGILLRPGEGSCWDRLHSGEACPQLDLVANDVTSVPQPDRVRARVRMRGRINLVHAPPHRQVLHHLKLSPGQPMACFAPDSVVLELASPGERSMIAVPVSEYAEAASDPLAGWEAVWIAHLDAAHGGSLRWLAQQHMPLTEADSVRGLQADSGGLTLRVYRPDAQRDLRIDFAAPARCGCRAMGAFEDLVTGPIQI